MSGKGDKVWAPNFDHGFVLGEIDDFGTGTIDVKPTDGGDMITAPMDAIYPAEEDHSKDCDDICGLMYLNEGTMLHNLDLRYKKDEIYTYTANVLLALNPYKSLPIYTPEHVKMYQGASLGVHPPHVYAIADKAYRDMRNLNLSQSIMCSGESGAGKTESTKHLLRYLTDSYGGGGDTADLEQRILAANPFLEAFGNAKTTRNNNSSRFGKFIELHFNAKSLVIGAYIEHYLLEKSRIISQTPAERNYQIFYRLCKGDPELAKRLNLNADVSMYNYCNKGMTEEVKGLDDVEEHKEMDESMTGCGLSDEEKASVYRVSAAVLHMGNVELEEAGDGTKITDGTKANLSGIAAMLGLDPDALEKGICYKTINIGGEISDKGLTLEQAQYGKDALAKSVYSKLFDWIVARCNQCFPYPKESDRGFIGILDIAGFEYFRVNSFEQFTINFANEKLQQFFNERVLKDEQELYVKEAIIFTEVDYVDNQDVIALIEDKPLGILAILDEVSKMPRADDKMFTNQVHAKFTKHIRLQIPRKSKMSYYKNLRNEEGFIIRHFAGAVCYQTDDFINKNNDALSFDAFTMLQGSTDVFVKPLVAPAEGEAVPKQGKMSLISLGTKFKKALDELMTKLQSTRSNFVRCIKPNQAFIPRIFTGGEILSQLQCAGMVTVMDLMQGGFPSRTQFKELYDMYKSSLPPALAKLDPRTFAKALFKALGLNEADFQFGVSRVFFRPGKFAEFDRIMKADPENLVLLVAKVMQWLIKARWKSVTWACVSALKFMHKIRARGQSAATMQKMIKLYFARKQHFPRAKGLHGLTNMVAEVKELEVMVNKLPKNKEKYLAQTAEMMTTIQENIQKVREDASITEKGIKEMETKLQASMEKQLAALKKEQEKQKLLEEQKRLAALKKKQEEEKAKRIAEEKRQAEELAAMEQRKIEAAQQLVEEKAAKVQAEKDALAQAKLDEKNAVKNAAAAKVAKAEADALAQDQRDQELAMKLSRDDGENAMAALDEDAAAQAKTGIAKQKKQAPMAEIKWSNKKQAQIYKKHNIVDWKQSKLRDMINTSNDIDLMEVCREEFYHRLKALKAWKKKKGMAVEEESGDGKPKKKRPKQKKKPTKERPQQFFRTKKGLNYYHFDGQWVVRQMLCRPDEPAQLFSAGRDDMDMISESLEESGLGRKAGAACSGRDFEKIWTTWGGDPYKGKLGPKKGGSIKKGKGGSVKKSSAKGGGGKKKAKAKGTTEKKKKKKKKEDPAEVSFAEFN